MISSLLAAALTFTATATGVEKGTAIEFFFAGANSDRDYESMFLIDEPVTRLCARLEKAGLPRGIPTDAAKCRLWPVGCAVTFSPALDEFVEGKMPPGLPIASFVYTGGARKSNNECEADTEMPASVCSYYTLSQSPFVFDGIYEQGMVYGAFKAARKLEKGQKVTFTVTWDASAMPRHLDIVARKDNAAEIIKILHKESEKHQVDATIGFDGELTVAEATAIANALASIDSPRVKINGCSNVFYRAFMPLVKWMDRKERLMQPFELTLADDGTERLVYIDEDWTVEGDDPKLTLKEISWSEAAKHDRTTTCFIFASKTERISRVLNAMQKLRLSKVINWYVFMR